ncbi:DUF2125 domain-containing protein [Roseicyclus sp. F158]|uniref:DUF2125 domain-containing protein n=1 Tax=Tropicimonas omnivorans TaxID=3075590 RepID=A0ABU3DFU6_9RHOB|nr:DUF2125 domain-containing protein [Roseicyclus sp. F158]MDT0682562.1 DUF2125 domain-containing protein [Roseicyclus sp. F158]
MTPKRLFLIVLVLAALWSGYWLAGAQGAKVAIGRLQENMQASGWEAEWSDVALRGFPNRFDVTLDEPALAPPGGDWRWTAPFFQVLSLSYKPHHLIAVWPNLQTIELGGESAQVRSDRMRASVVFVPGLALELDHAALVIESPRLQGDTASARARELRLAIRPTPGRENARDIGITALEPRITTYPGAPDVAARNVRADLAVTLDGPLDRSALSRAPRVERVEIRSATVELGQSRLRVTGDLAAGRGAYAEGDLRLVVENWRAMLDAAVASGLVPQRMAEQIRGAMGLLSSGEDVDLTLNFADGQTRLGPVSLGPAPRLGSGD